MSTPQGSDGEWRRNMNDPDTLDGSPVGVRSAMGFVRNRTALTIIGWMSVFVALACAGVGLLGRDDDSLPTEYAVLFAGLTLLVGCWCFYARAWIDRHERWDMFVTAARKRSWTTSLVFAAVALLIGGNEIWGLLSRPTTLDEAQWGFGLVFGFSGVVYLVDAAIGLHTLRAEQRQSAPKTQD